MKHNEPEDKKHSAHASDERSRCEGDGCNRIVAAWRLRECDYCHRKFCHICWMSHMHVEDYER